MKKKYFRIAALVLALVMMALAGCATPEPKPGGLELTEQQLEELAERLYPDIKREDTAQFGDPMSFTEIVKSFVDRGIYIGYVTVQDEDWDEYKQEGNIYIFTYVKMRVEKSLMGDWKEGDEILTRYYGYSVSTQNVWRNVEPNMRPLAKGETYLLIAYSLADDADYDYSMSFIYAGVMQEIEGEKYIVYREGATLSIMGKLRPFKEDEYTIKEVEIGNGETRKIALVKAEVAEQALVRVIENKEYEDWDSEHIPRISSEVED